MNLRARIYGLIFLSALILFSCEEDDNKIGLPPENNLGIFFADIPLQDKISQIWVDDQQLVFYNVQNDTIVSGLGTDFIISGSYQDPSFGLIEVVNFSEIGFLGVEYNQSTAVFDSVVLELRVASAYGNSIEGVEHKYDIFQLADPIKVKENGVNRKITRASTEPIGAQIGQLNFIIDPDSINLSFDDTGIILDDDIADKEDSAYFLNNFDANQTYIYTKSAKLDQTFGQSIFDQLKTNSVENTADLVEILKGIHLKTQGTNGAIMSFASRDVNTGLVFYYHEDTVSNSARYPIASFPSYNATSPNSNTTWMGSDFDDLSEFYTPYTTNNEKAYIQAGTNLFMKVDLAGLKQFKDSIPNATVQSAEILIQNVEEIDGLSSPSYISFHLTSADSLANNNFTVGSPPNFQSTSIIAQYDNDINGYRVNVPIFIETITTAENFEFDQLVITPSTTGNGIPINSNQRLVVNKSDVKLRFYYTIPDKNK